MTSHTEMTSWSPWEGCRVSLLTALLLGMMTGCSVQDDTEPAAQAGRAVMERAPSAPGPEGTKLHVAPGEGRAPRPEDSSLTSAASNLGPFTATGESWVSGSVSGSYYDTRAVDAWRESITEINTGSGKNKLSVLEHHWTVSGITAAADLLVIVAHQSGSTDRDAFTFSYSTNGVNWTNAITVATTVTSSTRFEAPISLGGASTVYVRVLDTDRTAGATALDTLVVDYLAVDIKMTCGNGLVEGRETCDDSNTQSCDGCSSSCKTELLQNWYPDGDGDGYGNPTATAQAAWCAPTGKVSNNTDCDDTNAAFNPGATDVCSDGVDQNCDGVDQACVCGDGVRGSSEACDDGNLASCDGCSADCQTVESLKPYYPDADGDGFGSTGTPVSAYCASPGRAGNNTDCNDSAAGTYPGAPDACSDGIDQDCNGQDRTCVLGSSCASNAECPTGFCVDGVCCESACDSGCQTCKSPLGSPGICTSEMDMTADPACGSYTCYGGKCASSCMWGGAVLFDGLCSTGNYCSKNATCQPKKANGTACSAASECTSGMCADGVCCNSSCDGACDACDVTGRVGTCGPRPAGSSGTPACAPFVCNGSGTSCPTSCVSNADCIGDYFCEAGTCTTKKDIGQACTGSLQCASGFCVDGYCCNSSCNGECDACDVPGSYGACSIQPAGIQGEPSCSPYVCDGIRAICPTKCAGEAGCVERSTCDLTTSTCSEPSGLPNGEACTQNTECQSSFCVDGLCCDTACGASCDACNLAGSEGVCTVRPAGSPGQPSCSPNLCGGRAECSTTCSSNADCAGGLPCREGVCAIPFALSRGWGGMESLDADNPAAKLRLYIETATVAKLHVRSSSNGIVVSLVNPAGQEFSLEGAAKAGIQVRHWDTASPELALQGGIYSPLTESGSHVTFEIPSPMPGAWYVKLSARTRPVTRMMGAQVQLTTDGKAGTALITDKQTYALGEPVGVWLHVRDLGVSPPAPLSGATAKVSFLEVFEDPNSGVPKIPPKPFFKTLTLADDGGGAGASGDGAAGDGVYSGRLTLTKASKYIVSAEVRGTDANGHVWIRTNSNIIEVE